MSALRPVTLIAGGAFAVHELSYLAGFGAAGRHAPADHRTCRAASGAGDRGGAGAVRHRGARRCGEARPPASPLTGLSPTLPRSWPFFGQELVEGLLAGADPVQIASVLVAHGVVSIPLALALGFVTWLAMRGLETVEARIATRFDQSTPRRAPRLGLRPRWLDVVLSPAMLAGSAAPRAPPSPA